VLTNNFNGLEFDFKLYPTENFKNFSLQKDFELGKLYYDSPNKNIMLIYWFEEHFKKMIEENATFQYITTITASDTYLIDNKISFTTKDPRINELYVPKPRIGYLQRDMLSMLNHFLIQINLLDATVLKQYKELFEENVPSLAKIILIFRYLIENFSDDFKIQFFCSRMLDPQLPLMYAQRADFMDNIINSIHNKTMNADFIKVIINYIDHRISENL
jgi:hypothetical protein